MPQRALSISNKALGILAALTAVLVTGCDVGTWPKREGKVVSDVHVDTLKFMPNGSRYLLADSATGILFEGFHLGFACTRVLDIGIEPTDLRTSPPGYLPALTLQLPADGECPLDTGASDSLVRVAFSYAGDTVRLYGSTGGPIDSAVVARGRMHADSLLYLASSITKTASKDRWIYRDSASGARQILFGDSLPPCDFLNQAEYSAGKDTTRVRFTWVTLDSCSGGPHADSVPVIPARR